MLRVLLSVLDSVDCPGRGHFYVETVVGVHPTCAPLIRHKRRQRRRSADHGLRIGPLFFSAFGPGSDQAVISGFDPRYPTKVVIQPIDPLATSVKVEGRRCSNGERLRFEYGASWDTPIAVLAPAGAADNGTPIGYTGYMLFTAAGKWVVSVADKDDNPLGSAVVLVQ